MPHWEPSCVQWRLKNRKRILLITLNTARRLIKKKWICRITLNSFDKKRYFSFFLSFKTQEPIVRWRFRWVRQVCSRTLPTVPILQPDCQRDTRSGVVPMEHGAFPIGLSRALFHRLLALNTSLENSAGLNATSDLWEGAHKRQSAPNTARYTPSASSGADRLLER